MTVKGVMMDLDEARTFLDKCDRWELRDHAFGDVELGWEREGMEVGGGYFGHQIESVWIRDDDAGIQGSFKRSDARQLRDCGILVSFERNDEAGPETYAEGVTMPGLTKEGVLKELTDG